jgi:hypothetical protein
VFTSIASKSKDVVLPESMKRSMSRQAEAERERPRPEGKSETTWRPATPAATATTRRTFAAAVRFVGLVVAVAMLVLVLGLLWVSGCKSGTGDEALANCGAVQRNLVGIGSPLILLLGGLGAFVRTYQVWRAGGRWWIWQGSGWFLLVLMLVVLTMTVPVALEAL